MEDTASLEATANTTAPKTKKKKIKQKRSASISTSTTPTLPTLKRFPPQGPAGFLYTDEARKAAEHLAGMVKSPSPAVPGGGGGNAATSNNNNNSGSVSVHSSLNLKDREWDQRRAASASPHMFVKDTKQKVELPILMTASPHLVPKGSAAMRLQSLTTMSQKRLETIRRLQAITKELNIDLRMPSNAEVPLSILASHYSEFGRWLPQAQAVLDNVEQTPSMQAQLMDEQIHQQILQQQQQQALQNARSPSRLSGAEVSDRQLGDELIKYELKISKAEESIHEKERQLNDLKFMQGKKKQEIDKLKEQLLTMQFATRQSIVSDNPETAVDGPAAELHSLQKKLQDLDKDFKMEMLNKRIYLNMIHRLQTMTAQDNKDLVEIQSLLVQYRHDSEKLKEQVRSSAKKLGSTLGQTDLAELKMVREMRREEYSKELDKRRAVVLEYALARHEMEEYEAKFKQVENLLSRLYNPQQMSPRKEAIRKRLASLEKTFNMMRAKLGETSINRIVELMQNQVEAQHCWIKESKDIEDKLETLKETKKQLTEQMHLLQFTVHEGIENREEEGGQPLGAAANNGTTSAADINVMSEQMGRRQRRQELILAIERNSQIVKEEDARIAHVKEGIVALHKKLHTTAIAGLPTAGNQLSNPTAGQISDIALVNLLGECEDAVAKLVENLDMVKKELEDNVANLVRSEKELGKAKRQQSMQTLLKNLGTMNEEHEAAMENIPSNDDLKSIKINGGFGHEEDAGDIESLLNSKESFRDITMLAMERKRISAEVVKISKEREKLDEEDKKEDRAIQMQQDMEDLNIRVDADAIMNDSNWPEDPNMDELHAEELDAQKEREEIKKKANKCLRMMMKKNPKEEK